VKAYVIMIYNFLEVSVSEDIYMNYIFRATFRVLVVKRWKGTRYN